MKVGTDVEWESSGSEKTGTIILEVFPGETQESAIGRLVAESGDKYNLNPIYVGPPRPETSYFVAVGGGPKAKPKVYHPRASSLRII